MSAAANRTERVIWLRHALMEMTMRYGLSKQRMAYAESDGRRERAEKARRAAHRQFAAIQRLANALTDIARGAR